MTPIRFLSIFLLLLTACSFDPQKQSAKFLASGQAYFAKEKYQEAEIQYDNAVQSDPRSAPAHYQLARTLLRLNKREAANRELLETLALDPGNTDASLELAALLLTRHEFDQAQAQIDKILKAHPENTRAHMLAADKYMLTRQAGAAAEQFEKSIELDPHCVECYVALGTVHLGQQDPGEALAVYKRAIAANPSSPQAHVALAEFYFSRKQNADAEREMRIACGLDASGVMPRLLLGRILSADGQSAAAESLYRELKSLAPEDPRAYQALGLFYRMTGQKEKAVAEFQSLAASKPNDVAVKDYLVDGLLDLGRIEQARPLNDALLKASPADPQALLAKGRLLFAERKYAEALETLQKASQSDPRSAKTLYYLGLAQIAQGDRFAAKTSFFNALKLDPQLTEAMAALASLYARANNYEEALRLTERALELNPNLAAAYTTRAEVLLAKDAIGRSEEAINQALRREPASLPALSVLLKVSIRGGKTRDAVQRISRLVEANPKNAGIHFLLGLGYFAIKDLDRAEGSVRQALTLDAHTPDAYSLLANIDFARGAVEQAKTHLTQAIAEDPRNVHNYMTLETEYEREGNWEEAKKICEKANRLDPESPLVAVQLAYLYAEHGGDISRAVAMAEKAKQALPNSPVVADVLGWSLYKLGAADAAVTQLKKSVDKSPQNALYKYHLGMSYTKTGHPDLAQRWLEAALRSDPKFPGAQSARDALERLNQPRH